MSANLNVTLNGEARALNAGLTVKTMLETLGLDPAKIAVERNLAIVPRSAYSQIAVTEGDRFEIVHFIGGGNAPLDFPPEDKPLVIAGRTYKSRLIVGTGKYKTYEENARALEASGAEMVTVAVRRVNLTDPKQPRLIDFIDPKKYTYLPNTAGCFTGEDAVRTLRLAREAGGWTLVKLEVLGNKKTLYPDMIETLRATEMLLKEGFQVMVYASDDPLMAKRLEEMGVAAIMPLAAPIGSGLGVQNPVGIRMIIEDAKIPVIVDAGVGTASDAAIAMELGCDAVLMNTAIAEAKNPVMMAGAMKHAVEAGRLAYLAGRMPKKRYADPSSPLAGLI
ncbi:MAG TPA: sulfur carrier protein ThiS [Rhizomicrobium sp.]|jgi:thiazole synthase|nr:sulfur carrier protein ThiS [Rhizomicrobium sp.]